MVVVAQLVITGLHELSESQVLPAARREMAHRRARSSKTTFSFFVTILALAAAMMLLEWRKRRLPSHGRSGRRGAAQSALVRARREQLWMTASCVASCAVHPSDHRRIYLRPRRPPRFPPPLRSSFENGAVRIPVASRERRRSASFRGGRPGRSRPLHRDREAGPHARRRFRRLRNLRNSGLLPEGPGNYLRQLRVRNRRFHHRDERRLQPHSAEIAYRRRARS